MNLHSIALNQLVPILSVACITGIATLPKVAQAQFSIGPQIIELTANRGQAQASITMTNSASAPIQTRTVIKPFTYDRESGFKELTSSPQDLTPYLQVYPVIVSIDGNTRRRMRFIARLAPNLPDGEYRAMVFTELNDIQVVQPNTQEVSDKRIELTTTIQPRFGVAVYVRKGNVSPKLSVDGFRWNNDRQQADILVKNEGKATGIVTGTWILKQGDRVIRKGEGSDTTVLAEADRYIKFAITPADKPTEKPIEKLAPGRYQIQGKILWGINRLKEIPYQYSFEVPAQK